MGKKLRRRIQGRRLGNSNLKQSVGAVFFSSSTKRFLFLLRKDSSFNGTWAFAGGKVEKEENFIDALHREIQEEVGETPSIRKLIPIDQFTNSKKGFEYHTYVAVVEEEFIPKLNCEHQGYAWTNIQGWPKPLHPGVFSTFKTEEIINKIKTIIELY